MNILQLATVDNGGGAWFLKDALDRHTDHECRAVRMYQSKLRYPHDILAPLQSEINELYDWADVVHLHDESGGLIFAQWQKRPKPVVITYHGSRYRRLHEAQNEVCKARGWRVTVSTLDLTAWGAEWLPTPRRDLYKFWNPGQKFTVVHAPTDRKRKRTDEVVEALPDVALVEGQTYADCLVEKAKAHVLVDGWLYGYGNNSTEAWAFGMPSVCGAIPVVRELMLDAWGYLPFAEATVENLGNVVEELRLDALFYNEVQDRGREHFMRYHHAPAVAARLLDLYERVMDEDGG